MFSSFIQLTRRCFALAAPYGRKKLLIVLTVIFANGIIQIAGVTSIFPFFALAAEPDRIKNSRVGSWLLGHLPEMSQNTMLIWAGLFSIGLLFFSNAATLYGEVIRLKYANGLGHFLRIKILESLAARPYGYFLERNSSNLLQKTIGDVNQFIHGVFISLMEAISRIVSTFFLVLTVFAVQPKIAIGACLLVGSFYFGAFILLRRRSRMLGEKIHATHQGIFITAQQFFGGIKPAIVQGKCQHFIEEFAHHSSEQARLSPKTPIYSNSPRYLIEPIAYGGLVAAVIWLAAKGQSFADILPNLTVMAFAGYRLLPSIQLLYSQITQITATQYTVHELETELLDMEEFSKQASSTSNIAKPITPISFEKAIHLENITFQYTKAPEPVIDNFSLTISKNSSVGIVGSTGSGKSTLVDIILGLHAPQSGHIRIDDKKLTSADFPAWRSLIGYVPQDIYLIDASLAENIAFGVRKKDIDHARIIESAKAAQIFDFIETNLPEKWETIVGERGVRLSGGQRQRIGLARALYLRPQILILDEATSALDVTTEAEVMEAINALQGSITMIVIAHRLSTIESCDSVVKLGKE